MDFKAMFSSLVDSVPFCRSCFRSEGLLVMVNRDKCIELISEVLQFKVPCPEIVRLCSQCWHNMNKLVCFRNSVRQANTLFNNLMERHKFGEMITSADISKLRSKFYKKDLKVHKCFYLNLSTDSIVLQNYQHGFIQITHNDGKNMGAIVKNENSKCKGTDEVQINLEDVKLEEKDEIIENGFSDTDFQWENDDYVTLHNLKCENVLHNLVPLASTEKPESQDNEYTDDSNYFISKLKAKKKLNNTEVIREESVKKKKKRNQEIEGIEMILLTKEEQLNEISDRLKDEHYLNAPYKCEHCAKIFSFEYTYQDHMRNHEKSYGSFVCDICTIRTQSKYQAARHAVRHSRRYQCLVCGERRVKKDGALEHYDSAHGTPGARVCHCGKTFWKNSQFWHHRRTHNRVLEEKRLTCEHCGKTFKTKDTLRIHMVFHSDEPEKARPHKCPFCDARFHNGALMRIHRSKHADARDFYCVECDKRFKTDAALKQHLKFSAPHATPDNLKHSCMTCEMRFSSQRSLNDHTHKVHLQTKPYQCDECQLSFYQKWSLTMHRRNIHEGYKKPKKYICTTCGKAFTTNTLLKNHTRTHTGERPYVCIHCAATFSQNSSLNTHIKLVHLKVKLPPQRRRNAEKIHVNSDSSPEETHKMDCL